MKTFPYYSFLYFSKNDTSEFREVSVIAQKQEYYPLVMLLRPCSTKQSGLPGTLQYGGTIQVHPEKSPQRMLLTVNISNPP